MGQVGDDGDALGVDTRRLSITIWALRGSRLAMGSSARIVLTLHQRPGNRHALLLAARQRLRPLQRRGDIQPLQRLERFELLGRCSPSKYQDER